MIWGLKKSTVGVSVQTAQDGIWNPERTVISGIVATEPYLPFTMYN